MNGDIQDRSLRVLAWSLHALGFVVVTAVLVTARTLVVAPVQESRNKLVAEMMETSKLAKETSQIQTDHAKAKESLQQVALRTRHISQRIPERLGEKQFLDDIIALAQREGVTVRDVVPGMVNHKTRCSEMSFRISAAGTYKHLCGLLEELSQFPRLVTVSDLAVTSSTQSSSYGLDITVRIYFKLRTNVAMMNREAGHG